MANTTVYFMVRIEIKAGCEQEFARLADQMIAVSRQEEGTLAYDWFMHSDQVHCRLLETYEDAAAVLAHIQGRAVQEFVPQILQIAKFTCFEVYGDPGKEARDVLEGVGANIYESWKAMKN